MQKEKDAIKKTVKLLPNMTEDEPKIRKSSKKFKIILNWKDIQTKTDFTNPLYNDDGCDDPLPPII